MRRGILLLLGTLLLSSAVIAAQPETGDPGVRVLVLVRGGDAAQRSPQEEATVVAEYSAWAHALREQGHLIAADELAGRSTWLAAGEAKATERSSSAGGYFLIKAHDLGEALVLVRGCPALRHGGRVEVTPVIAH